MSRQGHGPTRDPLDLPLELFNLIVDFSKAKDRWIMRLVCKRWRSALENNALAWSDLDLSEFNYGHLSDLTPRLLELGAGRITRIRLPEVQGSTATQALEAYVALSRSVLQKAPSVKCLALTHGFRSWNTNIVNPKLLVKLDMSRAAFLYTMAAGLGIFPCLEDLSIGDVLDLNIHGLPSAGNWPTAGSLLALKTLKIHARGPTYRLAFNKIITPALASAAPNLQRLSLRNLTHTTRNGACSGFAKLTKLRELELLDSQPNILPSPLPSSIERLRVLSRYSCTVPVGSGSLDLPVLDLPSLTELDMNMWCPNRGQDQVWKVSNLINFSNCKLKRLTVRPLYHRSDTSFSEEFLFDRVPTVRSFQPHCVTFFTQTMARAGNLCDLKFLDMKPGSHAPLDDVLISDLIAGCPKLNTLRVCGIATLTLSEIERFVTKPGQPIQRLHINAPRPNVSKRRLHLMDRHGVFFTDGKDIKDLRG